MKSIDLGYATSCKNQNQLIANALWNPFYWKWILFTKVFTGCFFSNLRFLSYFWLFPRCFQTKAPAFPQFVITAAYSFMANFLCIYLLFLEIFTGYSHKYWQQRTFAKANFTSHTRCMRVCAMINHSLLLCLFFMCIVSTATIAQILHVFFSRCT